MIKALIVDDEVDARISMELMINQFYNEDVEVVNSVSSIKEAVKVINTLHPELVFLDIEMPNESGFQLFEYFGDHYEFDVIFITAYQQYALSAFRFAALDYLLKPIDHKQLGEAILRFKRRNRNYSKLKIDTFINNLSNDLEINKKILLPSKDGYHILKINTIMYCRADVNYSTIYTSENKFFTIVSTLKNLEESLPNEIFFRCHKSYLVNFNFIKSFNRKMGKIILNDEKEIDIATRRIEPFMKIFLHK